MLRLKPFKAVRPRPSVASQIASVPYDVVNRDEAARLAAGNSLSFLHVVRSEIDLPPTVEPYDAKVYSKAKETFDRFMANGTLLREEADALYLYRQVMEGKTQIGVVGCVHIDDYENNLIKKHEKTRKDKEDDRTRCVDTLDANAEPVFLTYKDKPELDALVNVVVRQRPLYDFKAVDGIRHTVWKVPNGQPYVDIFKSVPHAYVADGHHRCASAWRAGVARRNANPNHSGNEEYNWFLAVLFPASQLRILPYNRLVKDLNGRSVEQFLADLKKTAKVQPTADLFPSRPGSVCMYVGGAWYSVEFPASAVPKNDPVGSLDVSLLQDRVLKNILGIADVRTDKRIDFVGGIRGPGELQARVDSGEMAVGFSMYPTTIHQLMSVADAGEIMPPKSTWFEPKLRSGLIIHTLDTPADILSAAMKAWKSGAARASTTASRPAKVARKSPSSSPSRKASVVVERKSSSIGKAKRGRSSVDKPAKGKQTSAKSWNKKMASQAGRAAKSGRSQTKTKRGK